jgi:hypothetical protein
MLRATTSAVEAQHRGTTSAADIGWEPFVVASKLYGWVIPADVWGSSAMSSCLARRHRDDLAIADDLVLPMNA